MTRRNPRDHRPLRPDSAAGRHRRREPAPPAWSTTRRRCTARCISCCRVRSARCRLSPGWTRPGAGRHPVVAAMKGTTPAGARSEQEAARWVRAMFARVAHRYDFANHLLSFNIDRYWRARTVRRVRHVLERPGARVLDICCGTGDLMLALGAERHGRGLLPPDAGAAPEPRAPGRRVRSRRAALPVRGRIARPGHRGLRLSQPGELRAGLAEMRRVLRPGGMAAILEFSQPPNPAFRGVVRLLLAAHPAVDRRRAFRLARRLHVPAGIRPQISRRRRNWRRRCARRGSRTCATSG